MTIASLRHRLKLNTPEMILLLSSASAGGAIAWIDSRPHWDDAGITAGLLLLAAGAMSVFGPRRPWLWGVAIGVWIPIHLILRAPTAGSAAGGSMILGIALAGAYAGMAVRRLIAAS